jgi:hypothetical protein
MVRSAHRCDGGERVSRSTLSPEETASYARVLTPFLSQAKSVSTIVNPKVCALSWLSLSLSCLCLGGRHRGWSRPCPSLTSRFLLQEDLVLLRLTTKKNELMVVPGELALRLTLSPSLDHAPPSHSPTCLRTCLCTVHRTKVHHGRGQDAGLHRHVIFDINAVPSFTLTSSSSSSFFLSHWG